MRFIRANVDHDISLPETKFWKFLLFSKFLQACKPSVHVWSKLVSPLLVQLLYQEPPLAQQLYLVDLLMAAHLGHTGGAFAGEYWHTHTGEIQMYSTLPSQHRSRCVSACSKLTCSVAGLQAFDPRVVSIVVASTGVVPSTVRSTATTLGSFIHGAALGACGSDSRDCGRCICRQ